MSQIARDFGPAANQLLTAVNTAINNIGLRIVGRGGPVLVTGAVTFYNPPPADRTAVAWLAKNGVIIGDSGVGLRLGADLQSQVVIHSIDLNAAVDDLYQIFVSSPTPVANFVVVQNASELLLQALNPNTAVVAGIGPATP